LREYWWMYRVKALRVEVLDITAGKGF